MVADRHQFADSFVCQLPGRSTGYRTGCIDGRSIECSYLGYGWIGTSDDVTTSTITINISNYINANVTGITVNMTLDHQRDGDLTITLTAPNGSVATLYSNPGDNGQNFINTTFSDLATKSILAGAAPYSNGPYIPLNQLSLLDGSQVNGTYRLTITDNFKNNTGSLINWSITVNSSAPTFVLQNRGPH